MAYDINEAKILVIEAAKTLLEEGLVARTWGNVSARIDDKHFVITPTGRAYKDLMPADIVPVNMKKLSYAGKIKPSSEVGIHAAAYNARSEANFVIHTHQPNASSLSALGGHFLPVGTVDEEAAKLLGPAIPCAEYGHPGSRKLRNAVNAIITQSFEANAVLMQNHGAIAIGESYENALEIIEKLEEVAGKFYETLIGEKKLTGGRSGEVKILKSNNPETVERKGHAVIHVRTPYIVRISEEGKTLLPYLDDMAQIGGVDIKCVEKNAGNQKIRDALRGRNAILVKGKGALVTGETADDAKATALILEKNCMAAYLAQKMGAAPISRINAVLDRNIYIRKYSRLMDTNK